MNYVVVAHSDTGIKKQVNQDSLCVKVADTKIGQIALAVLCDGMGGLKKGELASAELIRTFSGWFESRLPLIIQQENVFDEVKNQWQEILNELNSKIISYGERNSLTLGSTITAILFIGDKYITVNIGDSRIYKLDSEINQLTVDHTVVQQEINANRLTEEEAEKDTRRSILLQCVGASRIIEPDFTVGLIKKDEIYLLCSDGFRHKITSDEILGILSPRVLTNKEIMKNSLIDLVELDKSRNEKDNISAILVRTV